MGFVIGCSFTMWTLYKITNRAVSKNRCWYILRNAKWEPYELNETVNAYYDDFINDERYAIRKYGDIIYHFDDKGSFWKIYMQYGTTWRKLKYVEY